MRELYCRYAEKSTKLFYNDRFLWYKFSLVSFGRADNSGDSREVRTLLPDFDFPGGDYGRYVANVCHMSVEFELEEDGRYRVVGGGGCIGSDLRIRRKARILRTSRAVRAVLVARGVTPRNRRGVESEGRVREIGRTQ